MTKADVVAEIVKKRGVKKEEATTIIEELMKSIIKSLERGNPVFLRSFGNFVIKKRAEKKARNISKNTFIIIPEHHIPAFKPNKQFLEKVKRNTKI